ncbi:Succinyl-CoA ligase [ADP-forming] subunit beta [Operophtera brumata]|uniref:Succinyl-CoA ligase [ADP-forming] subunit beta n=1 Tax=Operophtera brumata TaxID=104452 RepID=A0A0L7LMX8_OPEBR|nr:Succinyl-CoA ligase [ADP-forming] subunit beta [Operophtera brumata]
MTTAVRLHKLFQFIDSYRSEHRLIGFLHIGNDYSVFLRAPKPHDTELIYELYEAQNIPDVGKYKPRLLAISKVPIEYIREQLMTFRSELYEAKHVDGNVIPGTQVKTLREWQIKQALNFQSNNGMLQEKMPILRTVL